LVLQAVNASRGTVSYQIIGSGTGANDTDVFAATGGGWFNSGLYQLSFTLAVATLARLGGQLRDIKYNRIGQLCLLPAVRLGHHLLSNVFHTGRGRDAHLEFAGFAHRQFGDHDSEFVHDQ
jgi:hypothetical protein